MFRTRFAERASPLLFAPLWLLLLTANPMHASAEDGRADLPDEDAFLYQPPVVLSASRLDQPAKEAPVTLTIIDRAMIEASGARHIADLFRMVPGFQVTQARGHEHIVAYHGLTGDHGKNMQVLVDGRSVYSLIAFGGADWFTLPYALDDIERIEVVQGSNSAAYGANAFLGVANIITRKTAEAEHARVTGTFGNRHVRDGSLQMSSVGNAVTLRATAGQRADLGLENFPDDHSRSQFANARVQWAPGGQDEVTLLMGAQEGRRTLGNGTQFSPIRTQSADSTFVQLRWQHTLSASSEILLQYYHNRDTIKERQDFNLAPFGLLTQAVEVEANRHHGEFQHIFAAGPRLRAVWGVEGRQDDAVSEFFFSDRARHHATLWRAFGNLEWRLRADTVANLGATTERYSLTGTHTAPRLSLSHHLTSDHTLRYAYTSAFLTPTLGEVQGNERYMVNGLLFDITFVGNPALQPAKLHAHEIGYMGDWRRLGLNLNARLFQEKVKGLFAERRVSTAPAVEILSPGANMLDNLEDLTVKGLEYQARLSLGSHGSFLLNQAFIDIDREPHVYLGGDRHDQSAPLRSLYALLDLRLPAGMRAGIAYQRVGALHWLGFGEAQPAHSHLDLRLAWDLRWPRTDLQIALAARNVLDQHYSEYRQENVIQPRYTFSLSATF